MTGSVASLSVFADEQVLSDIDVAFKLVDSDGIVITNAVGLSNNVCH
jgi:hypothetical protein